MKTSSWFTPLPPGYAGIGISRGVPYRLRAPAHLPRARAWGVVPEHAHRRRNTLSATSPRSSPSSILGQVVLDLQRLAGARRACLALLGAPTTKPAAWCHRALVSAWLFRLARPHRPRARPRGPRPRLVTPQTAPHPGPSEPAPGPFALCPPKPLTDRLAPVLALTDRLAPVLAKTVSVLTRSLTRPFEGSRNSHQTLALLGFLAEPTTTSKSVACKGVLVRFRPGHHPAFRPLIFEDFSRLIDRWTQWAASVGQFRSRYEPWRASSLRCLRAPSAAQFGYSDPPPSGAMAGHSHDLMLRRAGLREACRRSLPQPVGRKCGSPA